MAFTYLSPMVDVNEIDNTLTTPQVATSTGYVIMTSGWGPVMQPMMIDCETTLVNVFGKPSANNAKQWFTAANFLAYANSLYVTRIETKNQFNANGKGLTGWKNETVDVEQDGSVKTFNVVDDAGNIVQTKAGLVINNDSDYVNYYESGAGEFGQFAARYPGELGNSIMVTYADANTFRDAQGNSLWKWTDDSGVEHDWAAEFAGAPGTSKYALAKDGANDEIHLLVVDAGGRITGTKGTILEKYEYLSKAADGRTLDGVANFYREVLKSQSEYVYCMDMPEKELLGAPSSKEVQMIFSTSAEMDAWSKIAANMVVGRRCICLETGLIHKIEKRMDYSTGVAKNVIKFDDGASFESWVGENVLVRETGLVFKIEETEDESLTAIEVAEEDFGAMFGEGVADNTFRSLKAPVVEQLAGGADDWDFDDGDEMLAYDLVQDKDEIDIGLIACGATTQTVAKYVIENICEKRKDCVAFVSPCDGRGPILGNLDAEDRAGGLTTSALKVCAKTIEWRTGSAFNVSSSYGHMDSGWKYQYDKYNDCNRWIPLNGDMAGIYARTDDTNAPWWSGAGYNRGHVKNVIKLNFSPNKTMRDQLYPVGINPVVTFVGEGTILYGDKTLLAKPSAFDRINVRRLFIYLEKTLSQAAKYLLFEFNDPITRSYAIGLVDPLLRQVQSSRGISQYKVVCSEVNNPPEVVDANMFKISVHVAPSRSINFISLDFIAEKTGSSSFSEQG